MASGLLESTGDFLESELDQSCSDLHNNTDQSDDLRYMQYIVQGTVKQGPGNGAGMEQG